MTCLTFSLLLGVLGWSAVVQILNSNSKAGELFRQFVQGIIERIVGRRRETPPVDGSETNPLNENP